MYYITPIQRLINHLQIQQSLLYIRKLFPGFLWDSETVAGQRDYLLAMGQAFL